MTYVTQNLFFMGYGQTLTLNLHRVLDSIRVSPDKLLAKLEYFGLRADVKSGVSYILCMC